MANGKSLEVALFEALGKRGFTLAPYQERADLHFRVDRVILAPPGSGEACFFPQPLAVQVTTRPDDWVKRAAFVDYARVTGTRLVYLEIQDSEDGQLTEEIVNAVDAALRGIFYQANLPQIVLLRAKSNTYRYADLDGQLVQYRSWLATPLTGKLTGYIAHWRKGEQYGFINATVTGPEGQPTEVSFFFHATHVDEPAVKDLLGETEGDLSGSNRIPVCFEDGGLPSGEHWRKTALRVSRAP